MNVTETQPAEVGGNPTEHIYEGGGPRLALALAAVQQELPRIHKDQTANAGQYSYSYADLAAVSAELLPLLGKNGLAFTAWPRMVDGRLVLRYYLLHESGEWMSGDYPLKGGSPQQLGSEITYARRYCLCAVTGVAPDDDDDAAAAEGKRQAERAEQQAEIDQELQHARDAVRGAWAVQFGDFDVEAAGELYRKWSRGERGTLTTATAGQLRAFAAYLTALPQADAGSTPTTEPEPPADTVREARADKPMSRRDQGHMFVLFEKLGMKDDRQAQLAYLRAVLERDIQSRGDLLDADAPLILKALKADVEEAERTGLVPGQNGDS